MKILNVFPHNLAKKYNILSQSVPGLVEAQAQIGIEVGLLSTFPCPMTQELISIEGVKILKSPQKRQINPFFISKKWINQIEEQFGLPDLVHFHFVYDALQVALAKRFNTLRIPYITTPRGALTRIAQSRKNIKKRISNTLFYNAFLRNASAVHALTKIEEHDINQLFKCNTFVVPNGIPDSLFEKSKTLKPAIINDLHIGNDTLTLGFVGRLDVHHKGLDLLLKSLRKANDKLGNNKIKLFLVGPHYTTKSENQLNNLIDDLNLTGLIKLCGPQYGDDKICHFLSCDIFVHTSRFEGMPMGLLEAMALGKPAIATPGTNIQDIVINASGWTTDLSIDSITNLLLKVYYDRKSIVARGQNAQRYMIENLSWKKIALKLADQYSKIIKEK